MRNCASMLMFDQLQPLVKAAKMAAWACTAAAEENWDMYMHLYASFYHRSACS